MYSFYGGRPGSAFVIARTFESISSMKNAFAQGANYSDVHYDEYVLINTKDRNDKDNGKIFRRGYNTDNQLGGAEYIGTISGPPGASPMLIPTSYVHIADDSSPQKPTAIIYDEDSSQEIHPAGFRYAGPIHGETEEQTNQLIIANINNYQTQIDPQIDPEGAFQERKEYALNTFGIEKYLIWRASLNNQNVNNGKTIITEGVWTKFNGGLVPGDEWKSISWKAASFTDIDGNETTGYFAMRVPYPVNVFYMQKVLSSYPTENILVDVTNQYTVGKDEQGIYHKAEEYPSQENASNYPFFKIWQLNLPVIKPISVTDTSWQGVGKLYDDGKDGVISADNPYGTKRLYFTIPLNVEDNANYKLIEISGRMMVDSLGIHQQNDTDNFSDPNGVPYFDLNSSIIKNNVFFKTTKAYQILAGNDPNSEILQTGNNNLYAASGISKDINDEIVFNPTYQTGVIKSIRATDFGLTIDLFTNLKTSQIEKTDFVLVRLTHLSLRFYDYLLIPDNVGYRENTPELTVDKYHNSTLSSSTVYSELFPGREGE